MTQCEFNEYTPYLAQSLHRFYTEHDRLSHRKRMRSQANAAELVTGQVVSPDSAGERQLQSVLEDLFMH